MKISFLGACREVTGSCAFIETKQVNFLVDCGMFQGLNSYEKNFRPFLFEPEKIDFVILTHAHLDHIGRLPRLFKQGFRGKVISTQATRDLAKIILLDSAHIFAIDGRDPIFTEQDVFGVLELFECHNYGEQIQINDIKIKLSDAGHILGSTIFEVWVDDKKIVFSGDIGNANAPIMKDTAIIKDADLLIVESTYGGKIHPKRSIGIEKLKQAI